MEITREPRKFTPITIKIDTEEEYKLFKEVFGHTEESTFKDNPIHVFANQVFTALKEMK